MNTLKIGFTKDENKIINICRQINIEICDVDIDESIQTYFFEDIFEKCKKELTENQCKGVIGSLVKKGILEVDYPDEFRVSGGCPTTEYNFNPDSEWLKKEIEGESK